MTTGYTIGGDTLHSINKLNWSGQTFRPDSDFILQWIDLELNIPAFRPIPIVRLFHADVNHEPFGDSLSKRKWMDYPYWQTLTTKRVRFPMSPYTLVTDQYYLIMVTFFPPLPVGDLKWQYDKDDATYARGIRISSSDGGATWTKHYNDDHIFVLFGTPPVPPPPPEPPIHKHAPILLTLVNTPTGITIVYTTNVPCHLWMRWTTVPPQKHHVPVLVRGEPFRTDVRLCFVSYEDNQQQEPGDTLIHTFIKDPWPICETRWYYFHGTIDGIASPSTSPIFEKHRVEELPVLLFYELWTVTPSFAPAYAILFTEPFTS